MEVESVYLGTEGRLIRALPPPPAAAEGGAEWERLLAVAEYAPEESAEVLTFYNVVLSDASGKASVQQGDVKRRFVLDAAATAMQASDLGQKGGLVVAGTAAGSLFRLQLVSSGSYSQDTQWLLLDEDGSGEAGERLRPWQRLHTGEVAGLDLWRDSHQAVTVGRDGAIFLADALSEAAPQQLRAPSQTVSYAAVKWAGPTSFVTAGTTGGLEVWDQRSCRSGPSLRSPLDLGHTGLAELDRQQGMRARIACLAVHASRPHLCASGGSGGAAALWDLRFQAAPLALPLAGAAAGDVTEVHFEGQGGGDGGRLLLATQDGCLLRSATGGERPQATPLVRDVHGGVASFACDPTRAGHLFCLAGWECLLYAHPRPAAHAAT